MAALAEHETSLTSHLSTIEESVIAMLRKSDSDRLLDWERDKMVREIFRRPS
jgi:hypothetical protein